MTNLHKSNKTITKINLLNQTGPLHSRSNKQATTNQTDNSRSFCEWIWNSALQLVRESWQYNSSKIHTQNKGNQEKLFMDKQKRVGVLTGGGDAPGLNPAIKGLVYRGSRLGLNVVGLFDGWRGLLSPLPDVLELDRETVRRWDRDGGTNLGSSRTNPFKQVADDGSMHDRSAEVIENVEKLGLDAVVACGGEDTLGVAARLSRMGVNIVGVPKTIDKDLAATDYTLGFDTALRNVSEIIERSRTPAGSHGWVQIVEVMGRTAGHLALWSGVAGQAHLILIPEHPFRYDRVFELLKEGEVDPGLCGSSSGRG